MVAGRILIRGKSLPTCSGHLPVIHPLNSTGHGVSLLDTLAVPVHASGKNTGHVTGCLTAEILSNAVLSEKRVKAAALVRNEYLMLI